MFATPLDHLRSELGRLDLLLHREILRLRSSYRLSLDEFRGLYVSDEQVDALVARMAERTGVPDVGALTRQAALLREQNRVRLPLHFPWALLAREFGLSPVEEDVLLLALAPEIDLKYDTLFAYLHNDVTRKAPSCDLAARVLGSSDQERTAVRRALTPESTLLREGLLVAAAEPRPRLLGQEFGIAGAVARRLLGLENAEEPPQRTWEEVALPAAVIEPLRRLCPDSPPIFLESEDPTLVQRVAEAACQEWRLALLHVDLSADPLPGLAPRLRLSQRLRQRGLLLVGADVLWPTGSAASGDVRRFAAALVQIRGPLFVHVGPGQPWQAPFAGARLVSFSLPEPDYASRRQLWSSALGRRDEQVPDETIHALASRFVLPASRIEAATVAAMDGRSLERPGQPLDIEQLSEAARGQSEQALGRLARRVPLVHVWDDLVLPAATLAQLREVAAAARHRYLVYSGWGLGKRTAAGSGVKALFSGASGTGKTMSAGIIARELGLDLYQIDLAGVVSKYIGETEKNLDRIFRAARGSNAILFFDEADALLGKRSEVKDAHDRYANIEVAYLLQRMEEHDGIAILASNLAKNIDQAFARRMHYVVEFPVPDEELRLRIWKGMFPRQAPLAADVDLEFLARQFRLAGGDIRNVALAAAFLAADNGQRITMELLAKAMARHMLKQGRVPSSTEFKQYYALLAQSLVETTPVDRTQ